MTDTLMTGRGRAAGTAIAMALSVAATSSCAALGPDTGGAGDTAAAFASAVAHQDAVAACSLLAPETKSDVESAGASCEKALLGEDLPRAAGVQNVTAYGRSAQVVLHGDVVFLSRFADHDRWLVTAAGCRPRGDRPYHCAVSGG